MSATGRRHPRSPARALWLTVVALAIAAPLTAQIPPRDGAATGDTTVVLDDRFVAGSLRRWWWGDLYREAWAEPFSVPFLDLAGRSLRPIRASSEGSQSSADRVLFLTDPEGQLFAFASVERSLDSFLPDFLLASVARDFLAAQLASAYPVAPLIVDQLESVADVPNAPASLFALPDDPEMGAFRVEFAGKVGLLVGELVEGGGGRRLLGATSIIDSYEMHARMHARPADRVDSRAYLTARLIDVLVGDWAQQETQWRWAMPREGGAWIPLPLDRYQAFTRFDGVIPSKIWHANPILVGFGPRYPNIIGYHLSAEMLDRHIFADLPRAVWDSTAARLAAAITDSVINVAVRRVPPDLLALDGAFLADALRRRRDRLPEAALEFYRLLARKPDVYGTDIDERVDIRQLEGGAVDVRIAPRGSSGSPEAAHFERRFVGEETDEVRLFLGSGDDRVVVEGEASLPVKMRIIGGPGHDRLEARTSTAGVHWYDEDGIVEGAGRRRIRVDRRSYPNRDTLPRDPVRDRDWGAHTRPAGSILISGDYGLFLGAGFDRYNFGFRQDPYASRFQLIGGFSTRGKFDVTFGADFRTANSNRHILLDAWLSQLKVVHFYGFGNDSERIDDPGRFYNVDGTVLEVLPAYAFTPVPKLTLSAGVSALARTEAENSDRFISQVDSLYGTGDFGQVGVSAAVEYDSRDNFSSPSRGATLTVRGGVFPALLDVVSTYASIDAIGTGYYTPRFFDRLTVAGRVGSRLMFGLFPYFRSAFVGGGRSLRGWDTERFAGDASLYANLDLRMRLFRINLLMPGDLGAFGLVDAGRVWVDGASPGGLHWGYGGGLSLSLLDRSNTVTVSVAGGEERTIIYFDLGFRF